MAYQIPKPELKIFDESKCYSDLRIKEVMPFKDPDNYISELEGLTMKEKCAKLAYYVKKKDKKKVNDILYILDGMLDLNFSDSSGMSPLHYAVYYGLRDITHTLLRHSADINFINKYGENVVEAGRASIEANKKNKKYIKNNINIEACIQMIENWSGRIDIKQSSQDPNISAIRDNLNKIQEENKEEILKIISVKGKNIIDNKKKVSVVFEMIFNMAKDTELFLGVYVDVIITILNLDRSYNKETVHILLAKTFEYYTDAISAPNQSQNRNIIKFITHFYSNKISIITKSFLTKIIKDLFYVIEQSYDSERKELKEDECIQLLIIVLSVIKSDKSCYINYVERLSKFVDDSYCVLKKRLKFLIQDFAEDSPYFETLPIELKKLL